VTWKTHKRCGERKGVLAPPLYEKKQKGVLNGLGKKKKEGGIQEKGPNVSPLGFRKKRKHGTATLRIGKRSKKTGSEGSRPLKKEDPGLKRSLGKKET